jgi:uncharacterized protein YraI
MIRDSTSSPGSSTNQVHNEEMKPIHILVLIGIVLAAPAVAHAQVAGSTRVGARHRTTWLRIGSSC